MSRQQTDGKLAGKSAARLYEVVKEIVDRLDPIGLLALGCPDDEYAPEIERIAQRLATAKALSLEMVQTILHETFAEFFDDELAGPTERYREAAREIMQHLETLAI
jgi:hypothetical protein